MVTCQSADQLKTPAKVSWAFKMVSRFGSLGYTIMGKTANRTVVQKTIIDTLHKEGKPQTFIAKEAGCSQSTVNFLYGVQIWWDSWPVKHTNTWSFNQLLVLLAVWAGAKSCWKMKSASLKSWSAEGSMKCYKFLGKRMQRHWFSKNTMDQHQQMTLHPKSSQTVET